MSARILRAATFAMLVAFAACDRAQLGQASSYTPSKANDPGLSSDSTPEVQSRVDALGEVTNSFPNDYERMVHVLTNMARHAPNNACGDFTMAAMNPVDPTTKLPPLVYSAVGNQAARFSSQSMAQSGCFQHDSCCVLGKDASGKVSCTAGGMCTGSQTCNFTCSGGTKVEDRYALMGMTSFSGENIGYGYPTAYDAWCHGWMESDTSRASIYGNNTELGVGLYKESGGCGPIWTQSFGNGTVTIPHLPAASAMYAPPNPVDATNVYFAANFYDAEGLKPLRTEVVVNGHCIDLTKQWGYDDNGTYEAHFTDPAAIATGCQPYYFLFIDGNADRWTYPDKGSLSVAIGQNATCSEAYVTNQVPADCETQNQVCATGDTMPCYSGPAGTEGKGECKAGVQICKNGFWSACTAEVLPSNEICDGMDNNCDGQIDEGNPEGNSSCMASEERGQCLAGSRECIAGALVCIPKNHPDPEVCDGIDNDCDGVIDDGFPQLSCGVGECFRIVDSCVLGAPQTCVPGTPTPEVADGRDNDCDGVIDNGIDCRKPDGSGVGLSRLCYSYPVTAPDGGSIAIRSPCTRGTQTCGADGTWGPCNGEVGPSVEVCDGIDNDCNGTTDDLTELGWNRCGTGSCTVVQQACKLGKDNTCTPKDPAAEACDGRDNNCDGTIDEGCTCRTGNQIPCYTGPKYTLDAGVCHGGMRNCVDGTWTGCQEEVVPRTEYCDGLDDNCNGEVDDNCVEMDAGVSDGGIINDDGGVGNVDGGTDGGGGGGGCGCATGGANAAMILPMLLIGLAFSRRRKA